MRAVTTTMAMLLVGCCAESRRQVTISGSVSYDAFSGENIVLTLSESESSRCSGSQTPGVQVATTTLFEPGPFSLEGTVCWSGTPPSLDLIVLAKDEQSFPCKAGVFMQLPAKTASGVQAQLIDGNCPMRK
ncbi:MAG TPA: hypothetical protein VF518_02785 [Polyangia bacterium]